MSRLQGGLGPECMPGCSRVKDIPAGGELVQVVVRKPRLVCQQRDCSRVTFTQVSEQLPTRARCLSRLRGEVADAVIGSGRSVHEVAGAFGLSWSTVQAAVSAVAAVSLPDVDAMAVRHLGVDEHRFAHVRFFRDVRALASGRAVDVHVRQRRYRPGSGGDRRAYQRRGHRLADRA